MLLIDPAYSVWLLLLVALAATLYSSVGHGGASGYLAAMALFGLEPSVMKPAALSMNIFVTVLVLTRFYRAGYFNWRLFIPFIIASIPMAFLGGTLVLESATYRYLVGVALLFAMWRMFWRSREHRIVQPPSHWIAIPLGGLLGFMSGLTGVGGGIFLSPLLLLFHWTTMRGSAAIAAAFILVNSISGLAGYSLSATSWPSGIPLLIVAALAGAVVGSELGVRQMAPDRLCKLLGVVLAIAAAKMIATA